jgi:hypothetical protein
MIVKQILEKYIEAEKIHPAFERVTFFSWNDMLCLKNEIGNLQSDKKRLDWLSDRKNEIGNVQLPAKCVAENIHDMRAAIDSAMKASDK